jgi:hypothetical protein
MYLCVMKITIYVPEKHLENLHKFITEGIECDVLWFRDMQHGHGTYAVTIDYDIFIRLNDLSK